MASTNPTSASIVLMVPPVGFAFNPETSISNDFQNQPESSQYQLTAMNEFDHMVKTLISNGIRVIILNQDKSLPDAVFPNNWFSTHINDSNQRILMIYPMLTENRKREVNIKDLEQLLLNNNLNPQITVDWRTENTKNNNMILEGTGSLVFDRASKIVYASLSSRTNLNLVNKVAQYLGFHSIAFTSQNLRGNTIYHTNVMMGIGDKIAVICSSCIQEPEKRKMILNQLKSNNKQIIEITSEQVDKMCGNVLELTSNKGQQLLIMSKTAYSNFTSEQIKAISLKAKIIPVDISTVENIGGGSARCMMAEIF